jgi:riboflavin kinase/FMN adenylyltransferase
MRIFRRIENYEEAGSVVLSIGNFDGLHRGHQYLLQKNMDLATKKGSRTVVLSFLPHPMQVLKPELFCPLSTLREQEANLERLGIDDWVVEPFDSNLQEESARHFLDRLFGKIPIAAIVVGPDFQFGKGRHGTVALLKEVCEARGIEVVLPPAFLVSGQRVSSSQIRQLLGRGDVFRAGDLLGRPFTVWGVVTTGFHRGHKLGFPTANISCLTAKNLKRGVYMTLVTYRGQVWKGATNVGLHPTFGEDKELKVETHLLDFSENLYGEEIRLEFVRFLRPETKFASVEALQAQIKEDVEIVRKT